MSVLGLIGAIDIRDRLPHANWTIGQRSATTNLTWHWSGPAVRPDRQTGDGLIEQLIIDSNWQMRHGWGGTVNGAPHLMYHLAVDPMGTIYQTADIYEILWHCAHQDGNGRGLSLHFPLGQGQQPTSAQLFAAERATDLLRSQFSIPLSRIFGHLEWKHATACPGPDLMEALTRYRAGQMPNATPTPTPPGLRQFRLTCEGKANVRQGPGTNFPIAGTLKSGTVVFVDVVKAGRPVSGNPNWIHMARITHEQADLGFISETLGVWL
jgi:hypothetical protein